MIELFSANTPNGKKISIMLEEIGYEYKVTKVDINNGDQSFNQLYSENKNNKKITFHDSLDQSSIFKLGFKCDLALITSSWFETGPITVYEAFAMKLPIIGTRLGGIEELCTHNFNSLLFDLTDHIELSNLMISLIKNPKKIDYLRSGSIFCAAANRSLTDCADLLKFFLSSSLKDISTTFSTPPDPIITGTPAYKFVVSY